jgi:hypothetical protein
LCYKVDIKSNSKEAHMTAEIVASEVQPEIDEARIAWLVETAVSVADELGALSSDGLKVAVAKLHEPILAPGDARPITTHASRAVGVVGDGLLRFFRKNRAEELYALGKLQDEVEATVASESYDLRRLSLLGLVRMRKAPKN